ncbi:leucine-rich repeat-containing protein 18 [Engraulis encrasicolus]|uniref:leucine-rich repeat-containing protein 18 n=1 Tax=Engraulis encrasicolus TaxID=184585 RepID=UPI002FD5F58C
MAKDKVKKAAAEPKGRKVTLKMARKAVKVTAAGRRRLDLSNMGIATFPKCIASALCDVDELDLSRNALRKLPDAIANFTGLTWLDLHSNQLDALPPAIGKLTQLHSLDLSNNHLTAAGLPPELGLLSGLRKLNLGLNFLSYAPHFLCALRELRELGLFNNKLNKEPAHLLHLPKMLKLNLADNPLPLPPGPDPPPPHPDLLLVNQSHLCLTCRERCHTHQEKIHERASAPTRHHTLSHTNTHAAHSGLTRLHTPSHTNTHTHTANTQHSKTQILTPNSVAQE